jgi:YD repeat-containing protein
MTRSKVARACGNIIALLAFFWGSTSFATETVTYTYDAQGRMVQTATSGTVNNGQSTTTVYDAGNNRVNYCVNQACPSPPPPPSPPAPPSNLPPVANADSGGPMSKCAFKTIVVTTNDTNPEGNYPLTVTSASALSAGISISNFGPTSITIESNENGTTGETAQYVVADSLGATGVGTVTVNVTSTNLCNAIVVPPNTAPSDVKGGE